MPIPPQLSAAGPGAAVADFARPGQAPRGVPTGSGRLPIDGAAGLQPQGNPQWVLPTGSQRSRGDVPRGSAPPDDELVVRFYHEIDRPLWDEICRKLEQVRTLDGMGGSRWASSFTRFVEEVHQLVRRQPTSRLVALEQALMDPNMLPTQDGPDVGRVLVHLVRELPDIFKEGGPHMLVKWRSDSVHLTRYQCAALLAAAVFGVLPANRGMVPRGLDLPDYSLLQLLHRDSAKAKCLICYFWRICTTSRSKPEFLREKITFSRRYEQRRPVSEVIFNADRLLSKFHLANGAIEAAEGCLQADFANKYLGGGVLTGGNVQEEIRFSVSPECIVGLLFCEAMVDEEAITIVGTQQYCDYGGYGGTFHPTGRRPIDDGRPDHLNRRGPHIVALDALLDPGRRQYQTDLMEREFHKAYVACMGDLSEDEKSRCPAFATGNWGCGLFGGDPQLKALLQWLAASLAGREVVYYPFGDGRVQGLQRVADELQRRGCSCGKLWHLLENLPLAPGQDVFQEVLSGLATALPADAPSQPASSSWPAR